MSIYTIDFILWYNADCSWAVFRTHNGAPERLYEARTRRQCEDWLRTMKHQKRLPR